MPLEDPSTSQLSRYVLKDGVHLIGALRQTAVDVSGARHNRYQQMSPPSVFPDLSLEKSWNGTSGSSGKSGALTGKALIFVFIATASEWWPTCLLIDCRPSATGGGQKEPKSSQAMQLFICLSETLMDLMVPQLVRNSSFRGSTISTKYWRFGCI